MPVTSSPSPGRPARGAATSQPVSALLDVLGRRGTLRILWELRDGRAQSFRLLRTSCGDISPSVLNTRLGELRESRLLETTAEGYVLMPHAKALLRHLRPLNHWAETWAAGDGSS